MASVATKHCSAGQDAEPAGTWADINGWARDRD
jgi:hypothetical protein